MKKLLCILVALTLVMSMATMVSAKTADIKHQSVEGTATIDGVKDEAYDSGLILPIVQKGTSNGGGELLETAIATAYYLNDAEWVYLFVDVIDDTIDNTSANNYEQDSVEVFWMADNAKNQIRFHYDGVVDADSGTAPESVAVLTDTGYAIEIKFPITDVLNNEIETCIQVNYCADGARLHTTYIEGNAAGDDGWQRSNRQSEYDVWWTLVLAGEHADTRVDPEPEPMELTKDNYTTVQTIPVFVQLFTQDQVNWGWVGVGAGVNGTYGTPIEITWELLQNIAVWDETTTKDFTVDPKFNIQMGNPDFLKLPEGAVEGDTGETGTFGYTYSDIVIKADGYADVIYPAGHVEKELTVKQEAWGRGGDAIEISLVPTIKEQLGLDTAALCEYLKNVSSVSLTITLDSYNLVTPALIDEFLVALDAEDEALIVTLQEYADKVAAALESAKATTDVAALEELASDAQKAVNRAKKEAEGYTKATAWAEALQASVDEINALVEAAKAPVEEAPAETPAEEEKPAEEKPADTTPADKAEGGSTGLIIGIIAAVVVIAVVVILLAKKKK